MQRSLFLLILMGPCPFFTYRHDEYHYIEEEMTWYDAQAYCRNRSTDLATVYDMADVRRLCDSTQNQQEAWIGLYSEPGQQQWHWYLPGVKSNEDKEKWIRTGNKICWWREPNGKRFIGSCAQGQRPFICYDEKDQTNKFYLINNETTWPEAQNYCRQHHTDLISGLSQLQHRKLMKKISSNSSHFWIGLFRDTWRWSDGSSSSFRHWNVSYFDEPRSKKCAMTMLNETGRWKYDDCSARKRFFCRDDEVILIKENKTWEEALNFCRENHADLVSITNSVQQRRVQKTAKQATSEYVWLGLRYSCALDLWFWVNDHLVCYDNWASNVKSDDCEMCGAMGREGHEWFSRRENETLNFICAAYPDSGASG